MPASAIAKRLSDLGVDNDKVADGIARLREDYGVDDEEFDNTKTRICAVYLAGMAKNPLTKMAKLKELVSLKLGSLKAALGARPRQPVDGKRAHAEEAVSFYRDVTRFTPIEELDDEDHPPAG